MLTESEFVERFVAYMLKCRGQTFADGFSVERYARETAPSYFADQHMDGESPEDCAEADMAEWESA